MCLVRVRLLCYMYQVGLSRMPGLCGTILGNPKYDWAFMSVPQKHANDRPVFQPRYDLILFADGRIMATDPNFTYQWQSIGRLLYGTSPTVDIFCSGVD